MKPKWTAVCVILLLLPCVILVSFFKLELRNDRCTLEGLLHEVVKNHTATHVPTSKGAVRTLEELCHEVVKNHTTTHAPKGAVHTLEELRHEVVKNHTATHAPKGAVHSLKKQRISPLDARQQPNRLTVPCSRSYFCKGSACAYNPFHAPSRNITAKFQFWGDSVQAQMECDLRQWVHDAPWNGVVTSSFLHVACPWQCTVKASELKRKAAEADIIVFNVGAHYEEKPVQKLSEYLSQIQPIFEHFVQRGGLLVVRSISATHYNEPYGVHSPQVSANTKVCVPHTSNAMPSSVVDQIQALSRLAHSVNAVYLDVFNMSRGGYADHATTESNKPKLDCRHFCSSCSMYRNWNIQLMDIVQRHQTINKLRRQEVM
jgi:hypothetical protein